MTHDVSKISADSLFWVKHYLIEVHSVCIYLLNLIPNDLLICLHSLKSALIFENYSFDKSNKQNSNIKPVSPQFIIYCMVTQCQNIFTSCHIPPGNNGFYILQTGAIVHWTSIDLEVISTRCLWSFFICRRKSKLKTL